MARELLTVRERSSRTLTSRQWAKLEGDAAFWRLVDDRIVALEHTGRSTRSLRAYSFVGKAVLSECVIRIDEKVPGSLGSLLLFSEHPHAKLSDSPGHVTETDFILMAFVDRFLQMVERYLVFGRRKEYVTRGFRGAIPAGKIKVPATMRLWARGRRDQLYFERSELSPVNLANMLIGLALYVVEGILAASSEDRKRRERVRTNAMFFEDVGWQRLIRLPLREIDRMSRQLHELSLELQSLVVLARLLALHFGTNSLSLGETIPFSWFVNLESLFEDCFRKAMIIAAPEFNLSASDAKIGEQYIFPDQRVFRAVPDVVVAAGRIPLAVLDMKHKDLDKSPSNPDIYQLMAHARAWEVRKAALVFPSNEFSETDLGMSRLAVAIQVFTVDIGDLLDSAKQVISSMSMSSATGLEMEADAGEF